MRRRALLASGVAGLSTGLTAGCLGLSDDGDDGNGDENGEDDGSNGIGDEKTDSPSLPGSAPDSSITEAGLAPDPEDVPAADVSMDGLETTGQGGIDVPLLPMEHAYDWYRRRDARFVDARGRGQYEAGHVSGAVLSTQPDGLEEDDPVEEWPTDERIVAYCTCPHSMSGRRAASLLDEGYEAVFVLDEGLGPWEDAGYPMESAEGAARIGPSRTVRGDVGVAYAGEPVRVRHELTEQYYRSEVDADGRFELTFEFDGLDDDATIAVETPAWTRTGTIAALTGETLD